MKPVMPTRWLSQYLLIQYDYVAFFAGYSLRNRDDVIFPHNHLVSNFDHESRVLLAPRNPRPPRQHNYCLAVSAFFCVTITIFNHTMTTSSLLWLIPEILLRRCYYELSLLSILRVLYVISGERFRLYAGNWNLLHVNDYTPALCMFFSLMMIMFIPLSI